MHTSAGARDVVVQLVAGGDSGFAHLSDRELLANTRSLVGKSNQLFAALLAHLAEVEARGLHRTKACSSLYTYCIYELRFSEDAAARRAGAAKLVKRFPLLLDAIAHGELHLTGLLMLGPHLTPANLIEVLGRAKFRTKKELTKLVRELHPLPLVPDLIEPLGPETRPLHNPTWQEFVSSFAPAVRELPVGERPKDWSNDVSAESFAPALARVEAAQVEAARSELPPITRPQQYQLQFSTTEEHVQLIERAKALVGWSAPGKSLGELHADAMRLLVASLEKRKYGAGGATSKPESTTEGATTSRKGATTSREGAEEPARGDSSAGPQRAPVTPPQRQTGRHIPAAVRRAVYERDCARCTYVDERGERCHETHGLELHHRQPFGKRGPHSVKNLTLHCRAHNALLAELDFGLQLMTRARAPLRHESLAAERRASRQGLGAVE